MLPEYLRERFVEQGELGRGGMGVVLRAYDREVERMVALKIAHADLSPDDAHRFGEEARVTARLAHPNIVPVYDIYREGGAPRAFTMKVVEGETLDDVLARRDLRVTADLLLERVLPIVLDVCDAVSFAHNRGLLHRDLNPRNVMVGSFGEVYVTDWGLAATRDDLRGAALECLPGLSGTPAYMPPEQLWAQRELVDERSDVFGVSAILYQVLTGRPPFSGRTLEDIVAQTRQGAVEPPEAVRADLQLPDEICAIVREGLALDPAARPASVAALRARLDHFLRMGGWFPSTSFNAGALVAREGVREQTAYIVQQGRCEIFRGDGAERRVLREVGPGDVFGEIALFTDAPRTANIRALTDVRLLVVTPAMVERELERGGWLRAFVRAAGARYLELDRADAARDATRPPDGRDDS
ncbi:MAG: protein kinase [Candidatus Binatia bacterium]